jgi:predicted ATPase
LVAVKVLREGDAAALYRFKKEFRALADVQHPNLLRLGELYCERGKWFFTMELVHGCNFHEYVRPGGSRSPDEDTQVTAPDRRPSSSARPTIAAPSVAPPHGFDEPKLRKAAKQLATALAALHQAGRVHRDVKPSNVLIRDDGHLLLLDFGLIEETTSARDQLNRGLLVGTPAFMAPEQVDYQRIEPEADWYAFGVMLFLALTGQLPFVGTPSEILDAKCHRPAPRPTVLKRHLPEDLVELCCALLERDPRSRPLPSAILERLGVDSASAVPTTAATLDTAGRFVGRGEELEALTQALGRAQAGRRELVLVEGEPGVGKSALVRHFLTQATLAQPSIVVLAGRCYEQESVPFKGFDTIIDSLSHYLAGLEQDEALGLLKGGVRFLTSVFPALLRVPAVGRQVPADRAVDNPLALREQAFEQFRAILSAIAARVPLILFIDDLQWADRESVALLHALLSSTEAPACLVLATLRTDSQAAERRELVDLSALDELKPTVLSLFGLSREESRALWTTLWRSDRQTEAPGGDPEAAFAALCDDAAGHPLFLCELVRYARAPHAEGKRATRLQEVLSERIAALDDSARRFMETVALAGVPTDSSVITKAAELNPADSLNVLGVLRAAQLIRMSRHGDDRLVEPYHDRIREAALQRLRAPESAESLRIQELHLRLGRRLLEHSSDAELPTAVFSIVRHLNAASVLIVAQGERRHLSELNLLAGRQAKLATAYEAALEYVERGLTSLPADAWRTCYETCRDLYIERIEIEYLTGKRDAALVQFNELLPLLRTLEERAEVYVSKITLDTSCGLLHEAIDSARQALALLEVTLPKKAGAASVLTEYLALRLFQGRRPVPDLIHLPDLDDARLRLVTQLYIAMCPAAFFVDTNLLTVCLMRIARTSIRHGVNDASAYGLAGYGLVLAGALGKPEQAYQFGQLALRLNERFRNHRISAKLLVINGNYLTAWVRPWSEAKAQLQDALITGRQTGDTAYEVYAAATLPIVVYNEAGPVSDMQACNQSCRAIAHARRNDTMEAICTAFARYCTTLLGAPGERFSMGAEDASEAAFRQSLSAETTPVAIFYYFFLNAELSCLFDDTDRAAAFLAESDTLPAAIFSVPTTVEHCFFHALVAARRHDAASWRGRKKLRARVAKCVRKLKRWAACCPQNFEAQYLMATAEHARISADDHAGARYAEAIAAARRHGALKREALALELAARFYRQQRDEPTAESHRLEAVDAYRRWGAEAKAAALEST